MAKLLEKSILLSYIGIISLLLASTAAFAWGAVRTFDTLALMISSMGRDKFIAVSLIELLDSFLIAVALFIFAVSLYQLFIGPINLPSWMLAHNLPELKEKLGGVIILVMVVKFLERLVEWKDAFDSLLFAVSVGIVAGALIAQSYFGAKEKS